MPFVETFAKLDGEPSAPAAGKGFIQTTAPLDDDGPSLMDRIGGYLKNAANNVAPTEPDPTADMIMPAPTKSRIERTVEDAPSYNEKLLNDQSRRANWERSQPKPAVSAMTPLPDIAPTLRDRLQDSYASVIGGPDAAEMHRAHGAAEATAMLVGRGDGPSVSNDDAWQQARQGIGGMSQVPQIMAERFAKAVSFGLAAPVDASQSHSWQASVGGAGAELAGFIAGPAMLAGAMMPAKAAALLVPAVGDAFGTLLAKDILTQAATLGIASGLQSAGTAALDTHSLDEAAGTVGHSVIGGITTGATFGAAGRLLPDKTMTQWALRALGVSAGQDAISGTNPLDNRPLEDKLFSYATNVAFTRHGAGPRPIDPRAAPAAPPPTLDAAPVHAPDTISQAANVSDAISAATASVPNIDPSIIQGNHATSLDTTTGIAGEMNRIRALRKAAEPVAEPAVEPVVERLVPEEKPVGPDLSTPSDIHNVETLPEHTDATVRPNWEATVNEGGMAVRPADHAANDAIAAEFNEAQSGSNSLGESNALNDAVPVKVSNAADTPQIAIARGIADKLGIKLLVVEGEGGATPFNGVNFTTKDGQRTILVSKDSPINGLTVAGHEIGHDFQNQFPDLYGKAQPDGTYSGLLGVMHPLIGDARVAERQALYEKAGRPISHEQALGEVVNDMMGNRIVEPSFWNYVAQKNVGVFQKLAAVVKATLARITDGGAAYGEKQGAMPFGLTVKQLKEANGHIDRAMGKYLDDATQARVNLEAEHMATKTPAERMVAAPKEAALTGKIGADEPPIAEGMTRLYHGGTAGRYDGDAWFSTDRKYAEGYAGKDGRAGTEVQYADRPTAEVNAKADPDGYGQTPARGAHTTMEMSSDVTGLRKPLIESKTLDSYSPADVLAKEARDAKGQRSDAKESTDQQNRLKADAEAGEFTLSGSDRAADADPNQNTMFSVKEGKEGKEGEQARPGRTVRTEALIELRKRNSILESLKKCLGA